MTKSEQITSDLVKYKCAIRLNNFGDSEAIEKQYNLYGSPPYIVIESLEELLLDSELLAHQDKNHFEEAKGL